MGFIGFLFLMMGVIAAVWPYAGWYMSVGWKLKDAEPSDGYLVMQRVSGVIMALIGFIIMSSSCSS